MSNNVSEILDKSAFNELSVAQLTPVFQYDFSYNINGKLFITKDNNGTTSIDSNRVKLSTGASTNSSARIESRIPIKYRAGMGNVARFTALFTIGVSGSTQLAGIGDEGNGIFFGYNGSSFGVLRRYGGIKHVEELQITTGSSTAENITITLNGITTGNIAVTNSGNVTTTVNEIVAYTGWDLLGDGWTAHARGDTVVFQSFNAESKTGSYSINGATTAVGSFTIGITGVTQTDAWVAQTSWNQDSFDGTGESGITLDQTKGNVYQIKYQWLGFGRIYFYIENPLDGTFTLVHSMDYANTNIIPSFESPTLPICFLSMNTTNNTDIIVYSASCGGFTEGIVKNGDVRHGTSTTVAASSSEVPVLTIHNKYLYQGKINRNRSKLSFVSVSRDGTKVSSFKFYINSVLTDASFSDIDTNDSMITLDTSATALSGGDLLFSVSDDSVIDLNNSEFYLYPGQILTITQEAAASATGNINISLNWQEDF